MVRRFVYDVASDAVVEIGEIRLPASATGRFEEAVDRKSRLTDDRKAGWQLREASVERANRREFAFKKYGNEHRWAE